MPDFAVSTAFKARDRVSRSFKNMENRAGRFGNKANRAFKRASTGATKLRTIMGGILAAGVVSRGVGLLQRGFRGVTEEIIEFDDAITAAAAKLNVDRGTESFKRLEMAARDVGATTEFTATQAAQAIDELVKAGFNQEQAMASVRGATDLATIAAVELGDASNFAAGALGAFNLDADDSEQRLKNLTMVNDVLARTVSSAKTDIEAMNDTIKMAGPVAAAAGADFATFAAMAGAVAKANISGSLAGTALKGAILGLIAPTPKAIKQLKRLGVEAVDPLTGDMRDAVSIMADLSDATDKMGTAQKGAALNVIFGRRAIAGVSKMLALGGDWLRKYRKETIESGRTAKEVADDMRKSIGNRLRVLKSTAIEVGFRFVDAFKDKIPGAIDKAVETIREFDVNRAIEQIKDIFKGLKSVIKTLRQLKPLLIGIVSLFVAFEIAIKAVAAIQAIQFFIGMAKAVHGAVVAQGLLNAVMLANPVFALTLAIAALITVLALLNWEEVIKFYNEMVLVFEQGIASTVGFFVNFWNAIKPRFVNFWNFLIETFKPFVTGIRDGLKTIWNLFSSMLDNPFFAALETIFLPFITVPALIIKHWEPIKEFFTGLFNSIKAAFDVTIGAIVGTFKEIVTMAGKAQGFLGSLYSGEGGISGAIGRAVYGGEEEKTPPRQAPNATEVESRQREIGFEGKMTFVNAPPGAELETETRGAPPIQTEMLGENP